MIFPRIGKSQQMYCYKAFCLCWNCSNQLSVFLMIDEFVIISHYQGSGNDPDGRYLQVVIGRPSGNIDIDLLITVSKTKKNSLTDLET